MQQSNLTLGRNHQASTATARGLGPVNTVPLRGVTRELGIRSAGSQTRCTLRTTVVHIIFDLGYSLGHSENLENPKITSWIACLGEVLNQNDNGIPTQQTINRVTMTIAYRNWSRLRLLIY